MLALQGVADRASLAKQGEHQKYIGVVLSDCGENGELSVLLSGYLRDIYIFMFVLSCHFAS